MRNMDARASLSGLMTRRGTDRRLNLTIGIALVLHALLMLASAGPRRARPTTLLASLREDIAVHVVDEPAPASGGGDGAARGEPEPAAPPPTSTPPQPPRHTPKPAVREHILATAHSKDATFTTATTPFPTTPPSSDPAPTFVPTDSRSNQRLGRGGIGSGAGNAAGSGPGGLFGNGQFVGDGPGALKARVCFIPETTRSVMEIGNCEPIFEQFLDEIDVPARRFENGFPGFEERTEWFAVNISGTFTVSEAGTYRFRLKSDDGSRLVVDNQLVVDNDGIHDAISKRGSIELAEGRHRIALQYFQGMKFILALQLFVTPPGGSERIFSSTL